MPEGKTANGIDGLTNQLLLLCSAAVLVAHSVLGDGKEAGFQTGLFFLAVRIGSDIVSAIPMTVKKLNIGWCPNGGRTEPGSGSLCSFMH